MCWGNVRKSYHWGVSIGAGKQEQKEERKGDGGGYTRPQGFGRMRERKVTVTQSKPCQ